MQIDDRLLEYLEDLSCLTLSHDEKIRIKKDMREILDYMARLSELNTDGVVERSHPFDNVNVFRDDSPRPSFEGESILKNAPVRNDEFLIAPKTVE
jgi:aspartyl-tRNA(Asn)/glutamyl-tRNA(Gln) amidotransferase subunit C